MKKIIILLSFLFLTTSLSAQYTIKCEYLVNPELAIAHADSCARFWFQTYDNEYGGFYENVSREGNVTANTKTMLGQTRTAYGMARAFALTGDTTFLGYARGALDFMYQHTWDEINKGWFCEMNRDGSLISWASHNNDKWSFMQHYALLGIGAMYDVTRNETDRYYLFEGRKAVDDNMFDNRAGYEGYYETTGVDWSNPSGKGFTPTMDGITTHILQLYLLTKEQQYKDRLVLMADNVINHIEPAMDLFVYGFPEAYNTNWEPNLGNTLVFTGHMLKAAWCVTRTYLLNPKEEYLNFSTKIIEEVLEKGYDNQYGGNYSNYNGLTGNFTNGSYKDWWQLEQGFTSGLMNYYISGDEKFLQFADETLKFYMDHFVDRLYGEVYATTQRNGTGLDINKASYYKAGYHSVEIAYFIYLYGNLYLKNKPVSLYYKFDSADSVRTYSLYPLSIEDDKLVIASAELDGEEYTNFNSKTREITLDANTGGILKVTFKRPDASAIEDISVPDEFVLYPNYPNPFNPSTTIKFTNAKQGNVKVDVYNITGTLVKSLLNENVAVGTHTLSWNGTNKNGSKVSSGVYFIQCTHDNKRYLQKGILIK